MKKLIYSLATISFLSVLLITSTGSKVQAQDITVSYQTFYDELSPYGQWVYDPEYGNVWVPNEGGDFRPYGSRGYWAMTEYGNTWISDDPWGWAVYHYGRWTFNPYYGWIWVPGYEWAPAWVSWRFGHGYCGWAPLSPGYYVGSNYGCPDNWWAFTNPRYMYRHDHYNYWNDRGYNHTYIRQTTIINNVYTDNHTHVQYNYGPRASTIEQVTHQPVQVYRVSQSGRPGTTSIQQNTVNIYRPQVNHSTVNSARPTNVVTAPVGIGRPQSAPVNNHSVVPTFRQEIQRQNRGGNAEPGNNVRTGTNYTQQQNNNAGGRNVQPANQADPGRNGINRNQPVNQAEQGRNYQPQQDNRQDQPRNVQPQNRPEPQRFNPQQDNRQAQPANPPQNRPEPQRNPQPQNRPEPQRFNPQQEQPRNNQPQPQPRQEQPRQEQQHNNPPQQQSRPEPQRYNPPPQQQRQPAPAPQQQQPRPQPAPQPAPRPQPAQTERPGGRR